MGGRRFFIEFRSLREVRTARTGMPVSAWLGPPYFAVQIPRRLRSL